MSCLKYFHTSTGSAQALRQAQHRHFDRLSTGTSTGSAQALRQAQHRHFDELSVNGFILS
ncbi:MAG TPA: hypothetical protein VGA95_08485 [Thermodesulfobacteriota bacterium]